MKACGRDLRLALRAIPFRWCGRGLESRLVRRAVAGDGWQGARPVLRSPDRAG